MQTLIYIGAGFTAVAVVTVPAATFAAVAWAVRLLWRDTRGAPA